MPTLHKENDWSIRVNGDEPHPLPHVHVGSVRPPARLAQALLWIAAHQSELFTEYRRLNP